MNSEAALGPSISNPPTAPWWGLSSRGVALLALVVIATIAVYLPSLRNGWVSDDLPILVQNQSIRTSSFIANGFTHDVLWSIKQIQPQPAGAQRIVSSVRGRVVRAQCAIVRRQSSRAVASDEDRVAGDRGASVFSRRAIADRRSRRRNAGGGHLRHHAGARRAGGVGERDPRAAIHRIRAGGVDLPDPAKAGMVARTDALGALLRIRNPHARERDLFSRDRLCVPDDLRSRARQRHSAGAPGAHREHQRAYR